MIEQRKRIAVVFQRDPEGTTHVRDRLVGVFANARGDGVFEH